jgi:hypothetical protein
MCCSQREQAAGNTESNNRGMVCVRQLRPFWEKVEYTIQHYRDCRVRNTSRICYVDVVTFMGTFINVGTF